MNEPRDMTTVPEPTGHAVCQTMYVLPARYALCSDETTSLGQDYKAFVNRFCPVPETEHHRYTLRLLRPKSNVYIYVPGTPCIDRFYINDDSTLFPAKENKGGVTASSYWLVVPNVDAQVWIAISDTIWPERYRQEVMADPGKRMQEFNPMSGQSARSLVMAGDEATRTISRLVQEFRPDPGYLRGLHEYPGAPQHIFDPDLAHFDATERDEDTVKRRWQWSAAPFSWLYEAGEQAVRNDETTSPGPADAPAYPPVLEPLARHCSLGIALADPVGLCMDCTRLNAVAMHACGDLTAWYGDVVALAALHRERRPFFHPTEQTRFVMSSTPKGLQANASVSELLIPAMARVWDDLKEPLAVNVDFWWANLCAEGDWTLHQVFNDFVRPGNDLAPDARRVLAQCVSALTINHEQAKKVWGWLDADEGLAFMDLVSRTVRSGEPNADQPATDENFRDPHESLGALATAFSGVLLRRRPDGSLPAAAQNLLDALSASLEAYFTDLDPKYPGMFLDLVLSEMEELSIYDRPDVGSPKEGMRFARWGRSRPARLGRDQPLPEHSPSDPAPSSLLSTSGIYDWVPTEPRWNDLNDLSGLLKRGKSLRFTEKMRKTPSLASAMTVLKGALAVGSAYTLLREGADREAPGDKLENWASVLISVVAAAEAAVHMVELREMYHVANAYHTLAEYSQMLGSSRASAAKLLRPSLMSTREGLYKIIQVVKVADKALTVLGVALSAKDAYQCYQQEHYVSSLGNAFLTVSGVAALFGLAPVLVCTSAGVGLVCLLIGEQTRHDYLMERTYLGTKSGMRAIESDDAQPAPSYPFPDDLLFGRCLVPFSYKKGMIPPSALHHADLDGTPPCEVWNQRHEEVERSLGMIDLFELELHGEMEFDVKANRLYLFISATRVTSRSTLKIVSIQDPLFHRDFSTDEAQKLEGIGSRIMEAAWESGVRKGMACWSCSIPWTYGSPLVDDKPSMGNTVTFLFPQGFHLEMLVEFRYCPLLPSAGTDLEPLDVYAKKLEQYEQDLWEQEKNWNDALYKKALEQVYQERRRQEQADFLLLRNPMREAPGYMAKEKQAYREKLDRLDRENLEKYLSFYKKNTFRKNMVFNLSRTPYAIRQKGGATLGEGVIPLI